MKYFNILVIAIFLSACNQNVGKENPPDESGWRAVYKHDENGKAIAGDIDSLISGIRSGYSVRVGWGWQREVADSLLRLEHMAEPSYLSVIQEKDVSAIIDAHPLLESYFEIDKQNFAEGGHIWQCILTTRGTFNARVYHRSSGDLLKDWPQRQRITWFLEYPPQHQSTKSGPLYE